MRVYAIRQRATQWWMPPTKSGKGSTWVEAQAGAIPRLFMRPGNAHGWLTVWARGGQQAVAVPSSHESFIADDIEVQVTPMPDRNVDDYEVVALRLVEEPMI